MQMQGKWRKAIPISNCFHLKTSTQCIRCGNGESDVKCRESSKMWFETSREKSIRRNNEKATRAHSLLRLLRRQFHWSRHSVVGSSMDINCRRDTVKSEEIRFHENCFNGMTMLFVFQKHNFQRIDLSLSVESKTFRIQLPLRDTPAAAAGALE